MPNDWDLEKVATLLMWSGSEVTHAILGNRALTDSKMSMLNCMVGARPR